MFSVIIATCGRPDRLATALGCVGKAVQACGGVNRIILADNHPAYTALSVVEGQRSELGCEVIYLRTPPRNKCSALNAALRCVANGWVAFTDDDTVPAVDWLEKAKAYAEGSGVRVFGGRVDVGRVEEPIPWHMKEHGVVKPGGGGIFVRYAPLRESGILGPTTQVPLGSNIFVRKDVFDQYGGYNEALWDALGNKALGVDDGEFGIRLQRAGEPIGYCHESVVVHPCYAEKYAMKRRINNVYAYGWRTPLLFPEDGRARFPRHAVRRSVVDAIRGLSLVVRGQRASGVNRILEAVRSYGLVASCVWGAPRKMAMLLQERCDVSCRNSRGESQDSGAMTQKKD